jgi:NAD(P)-dependent dehydrogenase (short-subunit alcohol dehydrogenase family)
MTHPSGMAGPDLTGTRALITGGTSGIGLAMAVALAEAGALGGIDRDRERVQAAQGVVEAGARLAGQPPRGDPLG